MRYLILLLLTACATPYDAGDIEVFFCPGECEEVLLAALHAGDSRCAFFDALPEIVDMAYKSGPLIMEKDNSPDGVITDKSSAYMHNKFCILKERFVITGSMNPTHRGMHKNNNNLLLIESEILASNYMDEFREMEKGAFSGGKKVRYPRVNLSGILVENYFCPEDRCEDRVIETLKDAKMSIQFMTFSFTSAPIAEMLIHKHKKGLEISGIFEKSQNSRWSQYDRLKTLNVTLDDNPYNMHHKVFVIDSRIVITGSYNPTKNGNENNDENILIIHDEEIALQYIAELERIWPKDLPGL